MLNMLGPNCPPSKLKYLLCPLFATNAKQQQQFYRTFDDYFSTFEPEHTKEIQVTEKPQKSAKEPSKPLQVRKWPYVVLGMILIIAIAILIIDTIPRLLPEPESPPLEVTPIPTPTPPVVPTPTPPEQPLYQKYWDTIVEFYRKYWSSIRWVAILASLVIFGLTEWYHWNRRRLVVQKQRGKKPPWIYHIQVEAPELSFLKQSPFYTVARFMRQRLKSDIYQLDVGNTITSTIEAGGFPQFRYQALTRPPEYLILIDLPTYHDHYRYLADSMITALAQEGLFVTRYFYEENPRICFREVNEKREYLSDLHARYNNCRLLLFGIGDGLLNPFTGTLDTWTTLFHKWRDRAILTTVPPKVWGMREIALAQDFIVLPASLDGLAMLVDHFDNPAKLDLKAWKNADFQAPILSPFDEKERGVEDEIAALRGYLGEETFQWLCACAIYPELHWDLTLYLATLRCMPKNLISEENLLRLIRLPYFREGMLSNELREALVSELDAEQGRRIHKAIVDILEKEENAPPKESVAYDTYRLTLAEQQWMLARNDRKRLKEVRKSIETLDQTQMNQDYTLLRSLESAPISPLSVVLPKRLLKVFYSKGIPAFGIRPSIRVAFTVLTIIILILLIQPLSSVKQWELSGIEPLKGKIRWDEIHSPQIAEINLFNPESTAQSFFLQIGDIITEPDPNTPQIIVGQDVSLQLAPSERKIFDIVVYRSIEMSSLSDHDSEAERIIRIGTAEGYKFDTIQQVIYSRAMNVTPTPTPTLQPIFFEVIPTPTLESTSVSLSTKQGNDIIGLQVLTEMHDKLVVRIDYDYSGNWGAAGWLNAEAINTGEPDRNFTYFDMNGQAVNNAAKIGQNSMRMRLIGTQGGTQKGTQNFQFRTDAIEVCLFNGVGPEKHCETFPYVKQWSR